MTAISTQAHICPEKKKKLGVGQIILIIVMMLFVLICTLPFINVIAMSMSSKSAILRGAVSHRQRQFDVAQSALYHRTDGNLHRAGDGNDDSGGVSAVHASPQGAARHHVLHRLYHVLLRRHDSDLPERKGIRNA